MSKRIYCLSGGCANLILRDGGNYCPTCEDYRARIAELEARRIPTKEPYSDKCIEAINNLEDKFDIELVGIEHHTEWVDRCNRVQDKLVYTEELENQWQKDAQAANDRVVALEKAYKAIKDINTLSQIELDRLRAEVDRLKAENKEYARLFDVVNEELDKRDSEQAAKEAVGTVQESLTVEQSEAE